MSINVYQVGDLVRCPALFQNTAGAAIDPSVVLFKFTTPAGVETTYTYGTDAEVVRDSTGNYHVDLTASARGTWFYRWQSTGNGQAAEQAEFVVQPA